MSAPTPPLFAAELERVAILHTKRTLPGFGVRHIYRAWCIRCMDYARGPMPYRNTEWETRAPAVRAARRHLDSHARGEGYLDRMVTDSETVISTWIHGTSRP